MDSTTTLTNGAVFHNGSRRFRNVNVEITPTQVRVLNMVNGDLISEFSILEVVKAGEAWDVVNDTDPSLLPVRIVAQTGCGCSGMKHYVPDAEYLAAHLGRG